MPRTTKIVLTGPESTGKTTLTNQLADHFGVPLVKEYARQYIDQLERPYHAKDLIEIAEGQIKLEEAALEKNPKMIICDTDLLTIKIWLEDKFDTEDEWLTAMTRERMADLYLLCNTDLPWQPDPQREDSHRRDELLEKYQAELEQMEADWVKIRGIGKDREQGAIEALRAFK